MKYHLLTATSCRIISGSKLPKISQDFMATNF